MSVRTGLTIGVTAVAAAAVAFTAPSLAAHTQSAHHKAAPPAARTFYVQSSKVFDNFDSCDFKPLLTAKVKAPAAGYLAITSAVSADRDTDNINSAKLSTVIKVDGKHTSAPANAPLDLNGEVDETLNAINGVKVSKGKHKVQIFASECASGMAYIDNESLLIGWTSQGSATVVKPKTTVKARTNGH